jgi:hypothetical protein
MRDQPHERPPVRLLPGPAAPRRRERLSALRAAVPAIRQIPEPAAGATQSRIARDVPHEGNGGRVASSRGRRD